MGHILTERAADAIPVAIAARPPDAAVSAIAPPPAQRLVIVTLPPAARPFDGAAMTALVAAAARDLVARSESAADTGAPPEDVGPVDAAAADEVIAAHDARIAILRERLAAIGERAGTQAGDLYARLRRAEAARRLALARAGGDGATMLADRGGARAPSGMPHLLAATHATHVTRREPVMHGYRKGAFRVALAMPPHPPRWVPVPALAQLRHVRDSAAPHVAERGTTGRVATRGQLTDDAARARLAAARRALSQARLALTALPAPAVRPATPAGLWHWDGSERWTLAADRS